MHAITLEGWRAVLIPIALLTGGWAASRLSAHLLEEGGKRRWFIIGTLLYLFSGSQFVCAVRAFL